MAKAINWPLRFREQLLAKDDGVRCCALRLGQLYFEHHYWVDGETVDLRVNHRKIRKAVIDGPLKLTTIGRLTAEDLALLGPDLQTVDAILAYLAETYEKTVTPETEVTVVYYRTLPVVAEAVEAEDDPHR